MLLDQTHLIISVFNSSGYFPFLGPVSNKTDLPLYGVSLIFVMLKPDILCGKYLCQLLRLIFCYGNGMLQV